ncbi:hypothetical protein CsSME_00024865 [Camellia sinensis var. sinensis]
MDTLQVWNPNFFGGSVAIVVNLCIVSGGTGRSLDVRVDNVWETELNNNEPYNGIEAVRLSSPWTRSCERKRKYAEEASTSKNVGGKLQGSNLFVQPKAVARSGGADMHTKQRLHFRSNMAGVVKMVYAIKLKDMHLVHLRKTPFWLLFEAILINQLDYNEFRKCDDLVVSIIRTYSVRAGMFVIGGRSVDFTDVDVRLLFGLQCGDAFLDFTPRSRPTSDFVQRRCGDVTRITTKLVRDLLVDASEGENVSWNFIRYVDNLDAMKLYDWTGAVHSMLMSSIRDFHRTPHKVTGCVIALLYWLCEHTSVVKANSAHMFPRFLKWNVNELLASVRGVNLSGPLNFMVNPRQLVAAEHEMFILRGDAMVAKDCLDVSAREGGCDGCGKNETEGCKVGADGGKKVADSSNTNSEDRGNLPETPKMCGQSTMLRPDVLCGGEQLGFQIGTSKIVGGVGGRLVSCDRVESDVNEFGVSNIDKDDVIAKLEEEVVRLKKKNDIQAVHIVEGFESVLRVKDEEKKKLQLENAKLRQTVAILEEQLADQAVHNVMQRFKVGDLGHEGGVAGKGGCGYESHGGKQHSMPAYAEIVVDASPVTSIPASSKHIDSGVIADVVQCAKHQVVVINPISAEGGHVVGAPNSFVRCIKEKVRKNLQLPEFDYPKLRVQQRKVNSNACMLPNNVAGDGVGDVMGGKVVDVETAIGGGSKFSGFGINNKHTVWKMMTEQEKGIISSAYDRYGDGALMWIGRGDDNAVYFSDVKAIVRQGVVRGNVIDAYAEVLSDEQTRLNAGKDFPENSFFFSSICLDMMKNDNVAARNNYVMSNLSAARGARYIHFPICHLFHWTLVVYDTNVGSWKHYNSMRPRNGTGGAQYAEAMHVKNIVTEVQRQSLVERGMDDLVATQDFDIPLVFGDVCACDVNKYQMVCVSQRLRVRMVGVRALGKCGCSVLWFGAAQIMFKSIICLLACLPCIQGNFGDDGHVAFCTESGFPKFPHFKIFRWRLCIWQSSPCLALLFKKSVSQNNLPDSDSLAGLMMTQNSEEIVVMTAALEHGITLQSETNTDMPHPTRVRPPPMKTVCGLLRHHPNKGQLSVATSQNPFFRKLIVCARNAVPFSTIGRTKRNKGKFGASEHVLTLVGFTFEGRLVRLGCFV